LRQLVAIQVASFAILSTSCAIGAWAAAVSPQTSTTKKKAAPKSSAKVTAAKSTARAAPAAAKHTTAATKSTAAKRKSTVAVAVRHYAPQQPSQERYKEIQQALASKGYFHTEPDGNWGAASVDAL
jgi:peptidoglycan hydrolase-like protein with peptidoglycan-binding domain